MQQAGEFAWLTKSAMEGGGRSCDSRVPKKSITVGVESHPPGKRIKKKKSKKPWGKKKRNRVDELIRKREEKKGGGANKNLRITTVDPGPGWTKSKGGCGWGWPGPLTINLGNAIKPKTLKDHSPPSQKGGYQNQEKVKGKEVFFSEGG